MPEISRFYGLVIKMIFNDNDKHHKRKRQTRVA